MEERTTRLELDKALYDRRALLKAVYRFTDRAYIHLSQNENQWLVSWRAKEGKQVDTGELENELTPQTLRLQLLEGKRRSEKNTACPSDGVHGDRRKNGRFGTGRRRL